MEFLSSFEGSLSSSLEEYISWFEIDGRRRFWFKLLDKQLKQIGDAPSIGIILCPEKDNIEVEYTLRSSNKPIGVAAYKFTHKLDLYYSTQKTTMPESQHLDNIHFFQF